MACPFTSGCRSPKKHASRRSSQPEALYGRRRKCELPHKRQRPMWERLQQPGCYSGGRKKFSWGADPLPLQCAAWKGILCWSARASGRRSRYGLIRRLPAYHSRGPALALDLSLHDRDRGDRRSPKGRRAADAPAVLGLTRHCRRRPNNIEALSSRTPVSRAPSITPRGPRELPRLNRA